MIDTTAALDSLERLHLGGHTCATIDALAGDTGRHVDADREWYSHHAPCPVREGLQALRAELEALHARPAHVVVHETAHDDDAARYVGAAAAGFTGADCDRAHPDDQAGFTSMGRYAIEALAGHLDPHAADD